MMKVTILPKKEKEPTPLEKLELLTEKEEAKRSAKAINNLIKLAKSKDAFIDESIKN